ncbi:flagellar basal body rod protein FlgB [Burkholderia ubonensis]|uniref:flagellar basal body rod protein FlgB n=1 Tax=Burkholderia ubonensis TaxID=101571 RepID=UPI00075E8CBB|nr:flagellar basal body rod protein FlgB [Burkholderia ubonensis]KWB79418.1 flagellar biosynthesis protein FlgB [Burkholderia ubonensis]
MGWSLNDALGVHPAALELHVERSKVLASNLANETTPGYQARDFDFKAAMHDAQAGGAVILGDGAARELGYRVPNQSSMDGNTVELGVEQAAFAQNSADFQVALTFLDTEFKGLNMAINGNSMT